VYINQARVIKANVLASNGIIHVINSVMIPPAEIQAAGGGTVERERSRCAVTVSAISAPPE